MSKATENPLGRAVAAPPDYDSSVLFAIPRAQGRQLPELSGELPFAGSDRWFAWEVSWLNDKGVPQIAVARFDVPADSLNIIESKSLKLYLQSMNHSLLGSAAQLKTLITRDLSRVAAAPVAVELYGPEQWPALARAAVMAGECIDDDFSGVLPAEPERAVLECTGDEIVSEQLYSHLFRSRCPVTGQPDWASLAIAYTGPRIARCGLLAYLAGYRNHAAYHEQCVEQMFCDISVACRPSRLDICANFLRRGGLDISPRRYSGAPVSRDTLQLRQ